MEQPYEVKIDSEEEMNIEVTLPNGRVTVYVRDGRLEIRGFRKKLIIKPVAENSVFIELMRGK